MPTPRMLIRGSVSMVSAGGPVSPAPAAIMGERARVARIAVLVACDAGALALATLAAYVLWALPVKHQSLRLYLQLSPLLLLFVAAYAQAGLYPGFGLGPVEMLRRLSYSTIFGFLLLAAFSFALKLPPLYSRVT